MVQYFKHTSFRRMCLPPVMLCAAVLLFGDGCAVREKALTLWRPVKWTGERVTSPETIRSRPVSVDVKRLVSRENMRFSLLLPDDRLTTAVKVRQERTGEGGLLWYGQIEKEPQSSVMLSVVGDSVVGTIFSGRTGKLYRLRYEKGVHFIDEVASEKFPPEAEPIPVSGQRDTLAEADTCATDGPERIDALVVYTQAARNGAGGTNAMLATIYLAVAETNQSYINSDINQRLNLVHVAEVSYTETGTLATDLSNLKGKTDGNMDDVHTLRDRYGADVVAMITQSGDYCGIGYMMASVGNAFEASAFVVVMRSCATGNYSFGHELGHTMGARHDCYANSTINSPYVYNHGHTQPSPSDPATTPWRTIMAYNDACANVGVNCTRLPYWSNPNITLGGDATGTSTGTCQEDNHRTLNNTALTVANFRCSSPGRDDAWMKDTWNDTGAEPDPQQAGLPMWASPYIWVRNTQDSAHVHQHEHQNPESGQQNYVYVKLHNGGNATSGNLEVYFANASMSLSWPAAWTLIASTPLSPLAAHSTRIVEVPWTPNSPGHFCLVARWVSASDPMATAETANIEANVRANNNIIWRNVNIVDLVHDAAFTARVLVRNWARAPVPVTLTVRPAKEDRNFLRFGKITLKTEEPLTKIWAKGGYKGKGFKRSREGVVITDPRGAVLDNVLLPPGFEGVVEITFTRPRKGPYPRDTFVIEVVQTVTRDKQSRVVGGVSYEIHTDRVDK